MRRLMRMVFSGRGFSSKPLPSSGLVGGVEEGRSVGEEEGVGRRVRLSRPSWRARGSKGEE